MTQEGSTTLRLKVSPQIARIVEPGAPREFQMTAARGALPLSAKDLLTVLFFLCASHDAEIRSTAIKTLRELPEPLLSQALDDDSLPAQLLDLLARARLSDVNLMAAVIMHPATAQKTLLFLASKAGAAVLERLAAHQKLLDQNPELTSAIIANPAAEKSLKYQLGWKDPEPTGRSEPSPEVADDEFVDMHDGRSQEEIEALLMEADQAGLSKYQIALDLKVAEKIKVGLTGDKEWRSILIKEANKLVQGAVMKNPRITEGEVLTVAKNLTSSDEMIRSILLNKDWIKNYEIRKALVTHPKTPLPKALRFVSSLSMKDVKNLARSRQISRIIATAARKELDLRIKKTGG
jgi:hypothetical protein